jgi:hypothetical protein
MRDYKIIVTSETDPISKILYRARIDGYQYTAEGQGRTPREAIRELIAEIGDKHSQLLKEIKEKERAEFYDIDANIFDRLAFFQEFFNGDKRERVIVNLVELIKLYKIHQIYRGGEIVYYGEE